MEATTVVNEVGDGQRRWQKEEACGQADAQRKWRSWIDDNESNNVDSERDITREMPTVAEDARVITTNDRRQGDGWQQWRRWWLTVIAVAAKNPSIQKW